MEGYARRGNAVAGIKAVRACHNICPPPTKSPNSATQRCRGNLTASNLYPDPGLPYSPSSYTTLPAQMVYFTFP